MRRRTKDVQKAKRDWGGERGRGKQGDRRAGGGEGAGGVKREEEEESVSKGRKGEVLEED